MTTNYYTEWSNFNVTKVNITELDVTELNLIELGVTELNLTELSVTDLCATEMNITEVNVIVMNVTELNVTECIFCVIVAYGTRSNMRERHVEQIFNHIQLYQLKNSFNVSFTSEASHFSSFTPKFFFLSFPFTS
jgi:hypothetical protein